MRTTLRRSSAACVTIFLAMLCGCGILQQSLTGRASRSGTDFTGNYQFTGVPSTSGQLPGPVQAFVGAVTNTGLAFNATLHVVSANACVSPAADLAFTGSMDASGQITLTSTAVPNNPINITWLDDPTQSSNGIGTFTISGGGPCAMASTQFVSDGFSPVTGTYTGTFTSSSGTQAAVTATLTQGAADAHGQFPEAGTFAVTTPTCTNNFAVTGLVNGAALAVMFNPAAGASLGGFTGIIPDHALTVNIPSGISITGACNPGGYFGVLAKQ